MACARLLAAIVRWWAWGRRDWAAPRGPRREAGAVAADYREDVGAGARIRMVCSRYLLVLATPLLSPCRSPPCGSGGEVRRCV